MVVIIKKDATKEEIENELKKLKHPNNNEPHLAKHYGKLKGVFGDGLTYQKTIRNEWD